MYIDINSIKLLNPALAYKVAEIVINKICL